MHSNAADMSFIAKYVAEHLQTCCKHADALTQTLQSKTCIQFLTHISLRLIACVNTHEVQCAQFRIAFEQHAYVVQEAEFQEHFESMQQAADVSSNLDQVEACVSADTVNFELFKCRAKGLSQYTWSQLCSVRNCF